MPSIRIDGNDIFAVYNAVKQARELIMKEKRPVIIEAMTYRVGNHSTSDFAERYRDEKEMKKWKELLEKVSDPISRLEKYLIKKGTISKGFTEQVRENAKMKVREALKIANEEPKPPIEEMFEGVYD